MQWLQRTAAKEPDANPWSVESESTNAVGFRNLPLSPGKRGVLLFPARRPPTFGMQRRLRRRWAVNQSRVESSASRSVGDPFTWSSSQWTAFAAQLSQRRDEHAEQTGLDRLRKSPRGRQRLHFVRPCVFGQDRRERVRTCMIKVVNQLSLCPSIARHNKGGGLRTIDWVCWRSTKPIWIQPGSRLVLRKSCR
jgi:hypothetical protein